MSKQIEILFLGLVFIIGASQFSSNDNTIINERQNSYKACVRLRSKSPNFNLKCEQLIERMQLKKFPTNQKIKTLSENDIKSRKVNGNEESKLRLLIQQILNKNSLSKNWKYFNTIFVNGILLNGIISNLKIPIIYENKIRIKN